MTDIQAIPYPPNIAADRSYLSRFQRPTAPSYGQSTFDVHGLWQIRTSHVLGLERVYRLGREYERLYQRRSRSVAKTIRKIHLDPDQSRSFQAPRAHHVFARFSTLARATEGHDQLDEEFQRSWKRRPV